MTETRKIDLPSLPPKWSEYIARAFHEAYEDLAPQHGYETRKASAVPWVDVPVRNRNLMIATVGRLLDRDVIRPGGKEGIPAGMLETTETRIYQAFTKAAERGVMLDAMTVDELTRIVMVAIRGAVTEAGKAAQDAEINTHEIAEQLARDHGPNVDASTIDAALLDDYGLVDEFTPDDQRDALVEEIHGLIQQMGEGS